MISQFTIYMYLTHFSDVNHTFVRPSEITLSRFNYAWYYIIIKDIIVLLYWTKQNNNTREIIRYFMDVQKRATFLGVISSHAQIPKLIFFLRAHCNGKRGNFFWRIENTVIIFHLVSIVKYNNIQLWPSWEVNIHNY
jgi:hypothetical protein